MDTSAPRSPHEDRPFGDRFGAAEHFISPSPHPIPEAAQCLGCGYLLRGLCVTSCPECGREFSPGDPKTFNVELPGQRRRRWLRRGTALLLIGALVYLFCPRGVLRGTLVFTKPDCNERITFTRTQLRPPLWIPFNYPGLTRRVDSPGTTDVDCGPVKHVRVQFDLSIGGNASAWGTSRSNEPLLVNGQLATPDSASMILRSLLAPGNAGVHLGPPGE